jgi:hypothetical protein
MGGVSKTVRLPEDLLDAAEVRAEELGVTLTDVLIDALAKELSMPRDPSTALATEVSDVISAAFDPLAFPPDVTLQIFRRIRDDGRLRPLYDEAIRGPGGSASRPRRASVHRRIGRLVKRRLRGKVVGRSAPLDPSVELIESHALLEPT